MEKLENLAIGDIVEIEFKKGDGRFKDHPPVVGYVCDLPNSVGYLRLRSENTLYSMEGFQFHGTQTSYPINNIINLTILKKANP